MACPAVGDRRERLEADWHKPLIHNGSGNFEGLLCQERVPVEHGAVPEMKEGPSEPACRSRLQTAVSCFGSKDRGGERYGQKA
jgi:hypothetical protein